MELAERLPNIGENKGQLKVRLSNQIIHLLSEQMYSSPNKAIEELVVNAYDADAEECRIGIELGIGEESFIVVYDNGDGMDFEGLEQLWHVGESPKRGHEKSRRKDRKLIGKFGIGKLATYAIADRITYLSRQSDEILHVTCDYTDFQSDPEGGGAEVPLQVQGVNDPKVFRSEALFKRVCEAVDISADHLTNGTKSWTLCVLEGLKPKAADLKIGRLKWVLRTAMPLKSDFAIFVNASELKSSKADHDKVVEFKVGDLPTSRIKALNERFENPDWQWEVKNGTLRSKTFPAGVSGEVIVTDRSLVHGKSDDIERSHGFFVKVRGRLVNQRDEVFGLHALSHQTLNRFRADISADDLNSEVTAPREGLESGAKTTALRQLLLEIFNEARSRQNAEERKGAEADKRKRDVDRSYVPPRLIERPIADTLTMFGGSDGGSDADDSYFFMASQDSNAVDDLVEKLHAKRRGFQYDYMANGRTERLVKFDPSNATFTLNDDHELVTAYSHDPMASNLLEDIATSEVMLEIYMREAGIDPFVIGEVLERRDLLLRNLSQTRVYSLESIARNLRDSSDDQYDLEVAQVAAARALGFTAKHISGSGEPDGIARHDDPRDGDRKITLEAKSSASEPSLGSLAFDGLREHATRYNADGCMLIAPSYVGEQRKRKDAGGDEVDSAVEHRSVENRISCWTVEDLARVVEAVETHQIVATQVLQIVTKVFRPREVAAAVDQLLASNNMQQTYRDILAALRALNDKGPLREATREVSHVFTLLALNDGELKEPEVRSALVEISNASKGILRLNEDTIILNGSLDELSRRISSLTGQAGEPRRSSTFRKQDDKKTE